MSVVFLLVSPGAATADDAKPDLRKLIKSVDVAGTSIVIINMRSKMEHTYRVDDMTALKVNGVPGKIGDLKAGQEVIDSIERDNDTLDSATIVGYGDDTFKGK